MQLKHLELLNFKNFEQLQFSFDSKIVCFAGKNGVGKTNILDAIHYLCLTRSYFNPFDAQNIRFGELWFNIKGNIEGNDEDFEILCAFQKGIKKSLKVNGDEISRLASYIGRFPVVMISPYDNELLLMGSELRRKFMDNTLCQTSAQYLELLTVYNKILDKRNQYLKQCLENGNLDKTYLEILDIKLAQFGDDIYAARVGFVNTFNDLFLTYYSLLCNQNELVSLRYDSALINGAMLQLLSKSFESDRFLARTTTGIHKDDLVFELEGYPIKKFASQGQQKTFLVALKLAQLAYIYKELGKAPILLLDDIYEKLDDSRLKSLFSLLKRQEIGQVFKFMY